MTSYDAARGDECVQLASNNAENVQRRQHGGHESDRDVFVTGMVVTTTSW